jgi:hypothetical protein
MDSKTAYRKFKLRLNKLDTNFSQHIDEKKFCELFNKAQYHYISSLVKSENVNKDNIHKLQQLVVDKDLVGSTQDNIYVVDLPTDWYWVIRVSCIDDKCKNTLNCILVQEGNVNRLLQLDGWKPSVEWEETIFTIGDNKLRIFTGDFGIQSCNLVYYREPIKIDIETGENNIYGVTSEDVNPEWSDDITEEIIDLAILIASTDISDTTLFQTKGQIKQITS